MGARPLRPSVLASTGLLLHGSGMHTITEVGVYDARAPSATRILRVSIPLACGGCCSGSWRAEQPEDPGYPVPVS
jgi:hypothetical protein